MRSSGRWHHAGLPIVYLADSPAGALLEVCVHTTANDVPPDFTLLKIEGPETRIETVKPTELPAGWPSRLDLTRNLGTAWLQKKQSALLVVPSAIVPETANSLLNPAHADADQFKIIDVWSYPFDVRLKK